jgi:uncharacterized protein YciI
MTAGLLLAGAALNAELIANRARRTTTIPARGEFILRLFVLKNIFVDDFEERREPWREAHFAYLQQAIDRGDLVLAGHLSKEDGSPLGDGLLVFQTADAAIIEDFAKNDPYTERGLIVAWSIHPWNAVVRPKSWTASVIDA